MNVLVGELMAWLLDYYASATVMLLLAVGMQRLLGQPIQRLVLAWTTLVSLTLLACCCAMPIAARVTLRPIAPPAKPIVLAAPKITPPHVAVTRRPRLAFPTPPAVDFSPQRPLARIPVPAVQPQTEVAPPVLIPTPLPDLSTILAVGFLLGSSIVGVWKFIGIRQVRRLQRQSRPAPEFAQRELQDLISQGQRSPRLLISSDLKTAVAFGIWQPTILLPEAAIDEVERPRLRMLLAHEAAHIQRGDLWLLALARAVLLLMYAHPLYWWLRRRMRMDQELLADATAAAVCGREAYAESLVLWARRQLPPSRMAGVIGIWEAPGQLTRRIAMLLDHQTQVRTHYPRRWCWGTGFVTLTLVAVLSLLTLRPGRVARADEAAPPPMTETTSSTQQPAAPKAAAASESAQSPAKPANKRGVIPIDGTCVDEQNRPLADVRLSLFFTDYDDGRELELQAVKSDSQGHFQFTPVATSKLFTSTWYQLLPSSNKRLLVVAHSPGYATTACNIPLSASGTQSIDFRFHSSSSVQGRVIDGDGHPIAGATVAIDQFTRRDPTGLHQAVTDGDGRYVITDLEVWNRSQQQQARNAKPKSQVEHKRINGYGTVEHPDFPLVSFQLKEIPATQDFVLPRPAHLTGRVTFQETGKPAAKVHVELRNLAPEQSGDMPETVITDADGRYTASKPLLPGKYQLSTHLVGWPTVELTDIPLQSGANTADVQLETGGIIQGRIVELLPTEEPVTLENFSLIQALHIPSKTSSAMVMANPDGTFTLALKPGQHLITVRSYSDAFRWILVGSDRRPCQTVEITQRETKQLELKLLRNSQESFGDEGEWGDQLQRILDAKPDSPLLKEEPHISERAASAAIQQLGGEIKTEKINNRVHVVEVNMAHGTAPDGSPFENKKFQDVVNEEFTDEALFYLQKFPQLRSLSLTRGQATDQGLANLKSLQHLESVCLMSAWGITDAGIAHVAALPSLKKFCTHEAQQLTDESLRHLSQAKHLSSLMIGGGRFTDAGLQHLSAMKELTSLGVESAGPSITNTGLQYLKGLSQLKNLGLEPSQITDAGLQHLHGLQLLQTLDLSKSQVTPAGLEALRKVIPTLKLKPDNAHPKEHGDH
ncbi:MAG: M56 family metallopeptidase [Planctomycetota bacterium]